MKINSYKKYDVHPESIERLHKQSGVQCDVEKLPHAVVQGVSKLDRQTLGPDR